MKTDKDKDLLKNTTEDREPMTTNHGVAISTDQNPLKAGARGPTLLEHSLFGKDHAFRS